MQAERVAVQEEAGNIRQMQRTPGGEKWIGILKRLVLQQEKQLQSEEHGQCEVVTGGSTQIECKKKLQCRHTRNKDNAVPIQTSSTVVVRFHLARSYKSVAMDSFNEPSA